MNALQLPFLVEALLLLVAAAVGTWTRHGRRLRITKIVVHIFFFLWFTTGYGFIVYSLTKVSVSSLPWVAVVVMGLALVTQLISGIVILSRKESGRGLIGTHVASASILLLADVVAFFLVG